MSNKLEKKEKKFLVLFMVHIAMFLAILGLSVVMNETNDLSVNGRGFLAMTPVVPMLFLLRLVISHYRSLDEYIQRVMGEGLLWAVGIVGCAALAYGLLGEMVEVSPISPAFMLPAIAVIFGIAKIIRLRGDAHEE
ncbi:hypothetical protein N8588_00305 [Akkermansiaceae bacterium]|nr:hypothetical protein [Akkermansiaceae bacterium]MDA7534070.1 hypothetical protein [bacterium]MDA7514866.1 hypothetical protein [Akkermansiaceae bacterium]MDA7539762.1 hypothetical protein [Akkermansiaceae bacterium]MDA7621292.1 hypothetical protein [Akkermansiaceae bacterium]